MVTDYLQWRVDDNREKQIYDIMKKRQCGYKKAKKIVAQSKKHLTFEVRKSEVL